ncbi:DUF2184 domain-containing protein [Sessilibacter corallicola]|uniref:DUF2184 domain-containing protein n=1 Tax=Sessilibacter corallicola TaxID=2904075 RepID=UPI001E37E021|nr:DUF2184 domain-containing protein [Sessilibacter corallicola]MCE2029285.1 DUF2184 domain-containing protein [Sessilibacter corallicola]
MPMLVTVTDHNTGQSYTYDAGRHIDTADDGLGFFVSQLSNLEQKIYEVKYRHIVYQEYIPIDTSDPEWVDEVTYISYDAVTSGKFVGASASDLPRSDIESQKNTIPVFYGGNSYGYSLDELRKSQQLRIPVDATKGKMSFRGFQEHAQEVAFFGDDERDITGLINNPNVPLDNAIITDWEAATGQEIVSEMNGQLRSVWKNTANSQIPDTQLLSSDRWAIITEKKMDTGTDTTVLEYYKKNNLFTSRTNQPLDIKPLLELEEGGVGGVDRMIAYVRDPEVLTMRMPMPWRSLTPQPDGLTVLVPAEYKFGGVEIRYPVAAHYRDFQ